MSDSVGDRIQHAADHAQRAACSVGSGVGEVRQVIRAQPIAAALIVFMLGYLCGRVGSLIPSRHSFTGRD